jgi:hypothetical protein
MRRPEMLELIGLFLLWVVFTGIWAELSEWLTKDKS